MDSVVHGSSDRKSGCFSFPCLPVSVHSDVMQLMNPEVWHLNISSSHGRLFASIHGVYKQTWILSLCLSTDFVSIYTVVKFALCRHFICKDVGAANKKPVESEWQKDLSTKQK